MDYEQTPDVCFYCRGSGWIDFPARADGEFQPFRFTLEGREDNGSQYLFVVPCSCSRGLRLNANGFSEHLQKKVMEWKLTKERQPEKIA